MKSYTNNPRQIFILLVFCGVDKMLLRYEKFKNFNIFIINFSVQIILFFFRILSISFTNRMVFVGKLFLFVKFDYSFQSSETLLVKSLASIYSIMICLKTQMMVLVYNYLVFILKRHYYILLDPAN